jgi:transposase
MTIVENHTITVTGGVDTHSGFHVAAAVDSNGGVLGVETFDTTTHGYRELVAWLAGFGTISLVGVEGTGSYGAGLSRHLVCKGIAVVEVDRPNRQARHRGGKSDSVDAVAAARAALSGTATGVPKSRTGKIEAIRVLTVARRSAGDEWISIINQMRHLVFCAPDEIRARFLDLSPIKLARTCAALKPRRSDDDIVSLQRSQGGSSPSQRPSLVVAWRVRRLGRRHRHHRPTGVAVGAVNRDHRRPAHRAQDRFDPKTCRQGD